MIAKMKDEKNHIIIPDFYENVVELSGIEEKKSLKLHFL